MSGGADVGPLPNMELKQKSQKGKQRMCSVNVSVCAVFRFFFIYFFFSQLDQDN